MSATKRLAFFIFIDLVILLAVISDRMQPDTLVIVVALHGVEIAVRSQYEPSWNEPIGGKSHDGN